MLCGSLEGRGVWGRMCVHAKPLQSCLTLCDPMDCSPPGSSIHGSGVPCPPPEGLPDPEIKPASFVSLHRQVGSLPLMPPEKPLFWGNEYMYMSDWVPLLSTWNDHNIVNIIQRITIADLWLKLESSPWPPGCAGLNGHPSDAGHPAALLPLCWGNFYKWSLQFILWDMKESLTLLSCNFWQIIFPDGPRQCLSNEPTGGGKREMRWALWYPQIEKTASNNAMCPTAPSMAGSCLAGLAPVGQQLGFLFPQECPILLLPVEG